METLCHLPIVPIAPKNPQEIHLVMEYMAGGELYDRLFQQRVYKEERDPVGTTGSPWPCFDPKSCVLSGESSKKMVNTPQGLFRNDFKTSNSYYLLTVFSFEAFGAMTPMLSQLFGSFAKSLVGPLAESTTMQVFRIRIFLVLLHLPYFAQTRHQKMAAKTAKQMLLAVRSPQQQRQQHRS